MAEYSALPLFTDAYLADTRHLTTLQHGAYLLMLMTAWRTKTCAIPNDDDYLARITGMDKRTWGANKTILLAFWTLDDQQNWVQGRLLDERNYVEKKRNNNVEAGKASALKRLNRRSTTVEKSVNGKPTKTEQLANINSTPTPTPTPTPTVEKDTLSLLPNLPVRDDVKEAIEIYNSVATAIGGTVNQAITPDRRAKVKARLRECGGLDGWRVAMEKARASPYLRGEVNGFKLSLKFVCQQESFASLMEGKYDERKQPEKRATAIQSSLDAVEDAIDERIRTLAQTQGSDPSYSKNL
jgi:uncharacterized protein YdaU (DUF1376 family)